ncbi:MAG: sugar ABC transporter substrate-binding protein [Candidatus Limiplasma sp.]|nr:sugar ABC transporter substrate-binding protein [Candidatus Limiplasma sp.]
MKKRSLLALALVFALCLSLTTFGVAVAEGPKAVKNPYTDTLKIGFIIDNIGHPVGNAWKVGAEEEVAAYPNITLQCFDGKSSAETEIQQMTDLINQKYDGILLQATDSAALAASVREAEAAGIPVITLNLDADTPHTALVAMVDYEAGRMVAQAIAKSINDTGNVLIIQATPGASRGINLEAGFEDELKNHPGITLLDKQSGEWLTEKANEVMRDFMTKYDKIDGVFCENDAMAEGASQAAEAMGRLGEMVIWGADGESKALEYIEQGKMTGTIYTNCFDQGKTAFRLMLYALNSEIQPSTFTATPVVKMSPIVATKDNLDLIPASIRW